MSPSGHSAFSFRVSPRFRRFPKREFSQKSRRNFRRKKKNKRHAAAAENKSRRRKTYRRRRLFKQKLFAPKVAAAFSPCGNCRVEESVATIFHHLTAVLPQETHIFLTTPAEKTLFPRPDRFVFAPFSHRPRWLHSLTAPKGRAVNLTNGH